MKKIGNIHSDGRPILGLDSRDLLEILLETSREAILIPAHIWTPWFSVFGSKSGFDSLKECYEDLTGHIFAVETGLSSDPAMNHRISGLDGITLVSNSDAHSPSKLAREANIFDCEPDFKSIMNSLKGIQPGFKGTIEFYPEEGKYHLDGHRKCNLRFNPLETESLNGICPVCKRPLTIGVMNRIHQLAQRPEGFIDPSRPGYRCLIPLEEILSETLGKGPKTKTVQTAYMNLVSSLGSELDILLNTDIEKLNSHSILLAEAISKTRKGDILLLPGYDGEYGTVKIFKPHEKERLTGEQLIFNTPDKNIVKKIKNKTKHNKKIPPGKKTAPTRVKKEKEITLNKEQIYAVKRHGIPLSIVAGPGTGKTKTLVSRIEYEISRDIHAPENILALTFTRKAAAEITNRLREMGWTDMSVNTFHGFAYNLLCKYNTPPDLIDIDRTLSIIKELLEITGQDKRKAARIKKLISLAKQGLAQLEDINIPVWENIPKDIDNNIFKMYQDYLTKHDLTDIDDIIPDTISLLYKNESLLKTVQQKFTSILVDEFQDLNHAQYIFFKILCKEGKKDIFMIGDPDQAIYGFRGAEPVYFEHARTLFPQTETMDLKINYRSTPEILNLSAKTLKCCPVLKAACKNGRLPVLAKFNTDNAEAVFISKEIGALVGGTSHFALESGREDDRGETIYAFSDIAILYRLHGVGNKLCSVLRENSIPFQRTRPKAKNPLAEEADRIDPRARAVSIMSIHAAKGLEFPVVFIIGLEEGILPNFMNNSHKTCDINEELRLLYVAMTRARERLYMTTSGKRSIYGKSACRDISRFIKGIDSNLYSLISHDYIVKEKMEQLTIFNKK